MVATKSGKQVGPDVDAKPEETWSEVVKGAGKKGANKGGEPPRVVLSACDPNAQAAQAAGFLVAAPPVKTLAAEFDKAALQPAGGLRAALTSHSPLVDKKRANQTVGMDTEEKHVLL